MTCRTCKQDITIAVDHADVNGTDIDYDVERGHTLNCTDRNSGLILHEDWKKRQEAYRLNALKKYEVILTYRLYATDDEDAKEQALQHPEPDQIELYHHEPVHYEELEKLFTPAF